MPLCSVPIAFFLALICMVSCSTKCYMVSNTNIQNLCPMYRTTHLTPIQQIHTALRLQHFKPLFRYNCSIHSRPFICSSYVPFCYPSHPEFYVPPCRSLCSSVKSACLHVFVAVNLPWPTLLNCSRLHNPPHLCFGISPSPSPQSPSSLMLSPQSSSPSSPPSPSLRIKLILGLSLGLFAFVLISSILVITVRRYLRRLHAPPQPTPATVRFAASPATVHFSAAPPVPPPPSPPPSPSTPPLPPKLNNRPKSNHVTLYAVTTLFEKE